MEKKIIEQASWLGHRQAGILRSLRNFTQVSVGMLLDGAYLGLSGENIVVPAINKMGLSDVNLLGIPHASTRIVASNPGIKTVSKFLQSQISGDILAVAGCRRFHHLTHIQAVNKGLLEEKDYASIFSYNGDIDFAAFYTKFVALCRGEADIPKHIQDLWLQGMNQTMKNLSEIPETAYQVTPEGSGNIFLINRDRISS